MKITKKQSVKACDAVVDTVAVVAEPVCENECTPCCKYDNAINLIGGAIEALSEIAKDDPIAKDSIANLGVVMLDLKGC